MRIQRIHIDGFGHFAGREFGPFESNVTVIEGLNEAGKSTLLAFIRMVLFGWPQQKRQEHYPPLHGGRHGGSIVLVAPDGGAYTVERWEDSRGPRMLLTFPDGAQTADEQSLARLLGHASKGMFEEVFAFDAEVLRGLSGEANSAIFEAGMGVRALPKALASIEKRRSELFRPGGRNQRVARLLHELDAVKAELRKVDGEAAEYGRLTARLSELASELAAAAAAVADVTGQQRDHAPLLKGWPAWVQSQQLRAEIDKLPPAANLPPDGLARLEAAENAFAAADEALQGARHELEQWQLEASRPVPHERLLAESAAIADLRDRLSWYRGLVEALPKRVAERDAAQAELDTALRALGAGWDADRVEAFDSSLPVQHEVQEHRDTIDDATRHADTAAAEVERTARLVAEASEGERAARVTLESTPRPAYDTQGLHEAREALRHCRVLADEHNRAQSDATALAYQAAAAAGRAPLANDGSWPAWVRLAATGLLAIAAVVVLAIGVGAGGAGAVVTLAVEAMVVAGIVLVWRSGSTPHPGESEQNPLAARSHEADDREHRALAALVAAAARFGLQQPTAADLAALEARLEDEAALLARYERSVEALSIAAEAHRQAAAAHAEAVGTAELARAAVDVALREWDDWLAGHGLEAALRPALVATLMSSAAQARTLVSAVHDKQHRVSAIGRDIDAYNASLANIHHHLGIEDAGLDASAVIAAVTTLSARCNEAASAAEDRARARKSAATAAALVDEKSKAVDAAAARLATLLDAAGAEDAEAFRALATILEQRRTLERELAHCTTQLTTLSGPGDAITRFQQALAATDRAALDARTTALAEALEEAQKRRDDLRDERTTCETRLSQLVDGVQTSELLARREELQQELRAVAQQWAELTVARNVLERARRRWEEERQPAVVREASDLFAAITGQRYSRIVPQLESDTLKVVEAATGRQKEAGQLSRGTREQLYLALRFGLIRQFATRLPVVVDEVLINFDAERGARVAEAFGELAATNQVLVFTCHRWVAHLFEHAGPCAVTSLADAPSPDRPVLAPRLFAETR